MPGGPDRDRRAAGSAGRSPERRRSAGSASAALALAAPWLNIQFMNRSSNAPPCLMPATPELERASTGTGPSDAADSSRPARAACRRDSSCRTCRPCRRTTVRGDPFDDVIAVRGIVDHHPPGPLAGEPAADVVHDDDVAPRRVILSLADVPSPLLSGVRVSNAGNFPSAALPSCHGRYTSTASWRRRASGHHVPVHLDLVFRIAARPLGRWARAGVER